MEQQILRNQFEFPENDPQSVHQILTEAQELVKIKRPLGILVITIVDDSPKLGIDVNGAVKLEHLPKIAEAINHYMDSCVETFLTQSHLEQMNPTENPT